MDDLNNFLEYFGKSLTLITMLVSLAGLIIPIFPGTIIIWAVALLYGIVTGFDTLGIVILVVITVLMILSTLADNVMMGAKAREHGASWGGILLALGGGVVFTFIFPPVGGLIAAPLILFLVEYRRQGDHEKALQTVKAMAIGWGWAFVIRFGLGAVMIGLWAVWALSN
ncbi:MAG TPA: DUF456 domain-containing protein [Anaerolineales bacterium]|nr:DUF456 domain-containing protein [Anaerolineales bacterium]